MKYLSLVSAALALALAPALAHADTLLFTYTTTGSGIYTPYAYYSGAPETPFTNATVTLTTTVDSSQVRTAFDRGYSVRPIPMPNTCHWSSRSLERQFLR